MPGGAQAGDLISLGLNRGSVDDQTLILRTVLAYALYRTTNMIRHRGRVPRSCALDMPAQ